MKINLEQLNEMIKMQRQLDKYIMDKQGVEYDNSITKKIKLALFVELGELFNELPSSFKYWKPNAVDNRDKALVEYVDCLHFAMSLHYYRNDEIVTDELKMFEYYNYNSSSYKNIPDIMDSLFYIDLSSKENLLEGILLLGGYLGFTWEEIYETYIKKNKINYDRQVNVKEYMNNG